MPVSTNTLPKVDYKHYQLYKQTRRIRDQYADGVPLSKADRDIMLGILRMHPRGREKFGPGVNAVVIHQYIVGARCFFVVRADGSIEDFSVRKALGMTTGKRTPRIAALMAAFDYQGIIQKWRMFLTRQPR